MMRDTCIWFVMPHCYQEDIKALSGYCDGLSIMAGEIINSFVEDDIYVNAFLTNVVVPSYERKKKNKLNFYDNRFFSIILKIGVTNTIRRLLGVSQKKMKYIFFEMEIDAFIMDVINKDVIINFHDLTANNLLLIKKCIEKNIKCLVTLHLYVGDDKLYGTEYDELRHRERWLLQSYRGRLSVVSSGMKERILRDFPNIVREQVTVVENGIHIAKTNEGKKVFENLEYKNRKVFLCGGTINSRKNQVQILEALIDAPKLIKEECLFLFCGKDTTSGKFETTIRENDMTDYVKYLGVIKKEFMENLYNICYATISCSLVEAYGMTIIESYKYGKPAIFPYDFDAVDDLYNLETCILIEDRTNQAIIEAIHRCFFNKWDEEKIKRIAKKYDISRTKEKYMAIFDEMLEE